VLIFRDCHLVATHDPLVVFTYERAFPKIVPVSFIQRELSSLEKAAKAKEANLPAPGVGTQSKNLDPNTATCSYFLSEVGSIGRSIINISSDYPSRRECVKVKRKSLDEEV
jgi:hypothetical protein